MMFINITITTRPFLLQYKQSQITTPQATATISPSSLIMERMMINKKNNNILRRMNRDSQTILSKNKPQVRIIHIYAPEIIKTDPANFRELVQRLTGKPSFTREKINMKRKMKSVGNKRSDEVGRSKLERVKSEEEAEIWRSSSISSGGSGDNDSGGFLNGFADIEDGFMQQFGQFQPSSEFLSNNHNPLSTHHQHHNPNPHRHHQQQQHHFFGEEDHTNDLVI